MANYIVWGIGWIYSKEGNVMHKRSLLEAMFIAAALIVGMSVILTAFFGSLALLTNAFGKIGAIAWAIGVLFIFTTIAFYGDDE